MPPEGIIAVLVSLEVNLITPQLPSSTKNVVSV